MEVNNQKLGKGIIILSIFTFYDLPIARTPRRISRSSRTPFDIRKCFPFRSPLLSK